MPIRPDLRPFYRGPAWRATRERIRERATDRCEQCGKPNHRRLWVVSIVDVKAYFEPWQAWSLVKGDGQRWILCVTGRPFRPLSGGQTWRLRGAEWKLARRIRVICNVAHLNHTSGDDRDENLKFLCQWCHLNYDKLHHRETRATRKDAARPIKWEGTITV